MTTPIGSASSAYGIQNVFNAEKDTQQTHEKSEKEIKEKHHQPDHDALSEREYYIGVMMAESGHSRGVAEAAVDTWY
jgi:hypothetical protein